MSKSAKPAAPQAPAAPAHATPGDALSAVRQVIELADGLSAVADRLRERVLDDIRHHEDGNVPASTRGTARALLENEMLLRQRANTLYADAAAHVVQGLGQPQARLLAVTADAAEKIRRIGTIAEVTSLVGSVLALAGAVASGHAGHALDALEEIQLHNAALDALKPRASS